MVNILSIGCIYGFSISALFVLVGIVVSGFIKIIKS